MSYPIFNTPELDERSMYLRSLVLRGLIGGGRGHIGSSLSLIEIIRVLYDDFLNFDSQKPLWEERDRFILSKGHGCLAHYALLADKGFIDPVTLDSFCHNDGILGGHPERGEVPGIEASTGALGHGLSIGVGIAMAQRIKNKDTKTVVVTGDGEINEGSVWEAAMCAGNHTLENLIVMIDYNKIQSYGFTKEVADLEPLKDKWDSFGFGVKEVDGHNVDSLKDTLASLPNSKGKPSAIICHTIKGKGFTFAENKPEWHHKSSLKDEDIEEMKKCLTINS
ncbi:MAG: transketolase [SAR86 cluster bacterium]|jgi:transketolase|nr:transketolase [SAR86 cluster bacterium]